MSVQFVCGEYMSSVCVGITDKSTFIPTKTIPTFRDHIAGDHIKTSHTM